MGNSTCTPGGCVPDMIKLFSLKEEKAEEVTAGVSKPKIPPGLIRMQKDMSELKMDKGMELKLYNGPEDLMNFKIHVSPDDGMYKRGYFVFDFKVRDHGLPPEHRHGGSR